MCLTWAAEGFAIGEAVRGQRCAQYCSSSLVVTVDCALPQGYWIAQGCEPLPDEGGPSVDDFILTPTVKAHVRGFARALSLQKYPLLLQGPTSSGKTTLVEYIARMTGHKTIRINNHQHTDLQVCIMSLHHLKSRTTRMLECVSFAWHAVCDSNCCLHLGLQCITRSMIIQTDVPNALNNELTIVTRYATAYRIAPRHNVSASAGVSGSICLG